MWNKPAEYRSCTNCGERCKLLPIPEMRKNQVCGKCGTPLPHPVIIEAVDDMLADVAFSQTEVRLLQQVVRSAIAPKSAFSMPFVATGEMVLTLKNILDKLNVPYGE